MMKLSNSDRLLKATKECADCDYQLVDQLRAMNKMILPEKPEILPRPFEIIVTQEFLDILKKSGGWAFPITYKIGERLTIYVS